MKLTQIKARQMMYIIQYSSAALGPVKNLLVPSINAHTRYNTAGTALKKVRSIYALAGEWSFANVLLEEYLKVHWLCD